ncbi:cadherin [Flavobacterium akiainvivens]|uniref:Cadherin n=1 Tax=Flavobacterium akiainvivens TaxID=1202724 RepID=A0A0M9VJ17_9FLAO|nr:PQQ-dependent sugar dehydrogenase [Flavobacterium akiainvivens]KOS07270.1 cadherin [Flavobacterium akiainvivens]SFQ45981.1 Por secretion system C-terminal sorting domain-containing protein [Flavobacterium akiainvivens]
MKKTLLSALLLCGSMAFAQTIALQSFATGFTNPVEITNAGDGRLFVVQQGGQIKILNEDGSVNSTNFLDISTLITEGGEQGLLGLAFAPDYETSGHFYVYYNNTDGDTVVARYSRSSTNEDVADAASAEIVLTMDQPQTNHNGGCIRFGQDGYLYIAKGDGGGGGDQDNNAQNVNSLLGKLLRIDVTGTDTYTIPEDNPFVGVDGEDEIWATGLRNPWKFSFNRLNGDLWIADVGQEEIEEINKVAPDAAGINYGWRCFEGSEVYNSDGCSLVEMYTPPFAEYTHNESDGCSITGGYVYTGDTYTALQGKYVFADYCNDKIGIVATDGTISWSAEFSGSLATFGEDIDGELYVAGKNNGTVYKITDSTAGLENVTNAVFSLYPNPAKNQVTVNLNAESATLAVYDLGGKILMQQELHNAENSVDTAALQQGIYFVQVSHNGGSTLQKLAIN